MNRKLIAVLFIVSCGTPNDGSPNRTQTPDSVVSPASRPSAGVDTAWLRDWYTRRSETIDHLVITSTSPTFVGIAVGETSQAAARRTRIDIWSVPLQDQPFAQSPAEDAAWIDTMFLVHPGNRIPPYLVTRAAYEDTNSAVQFVVNEGILRAVVIDPPASDERYSPSEFVTHAGPHGSICKVGIRWEDTLDEKADTWVWYEVSPRGLKRAQIEPSCPAA